ncbi:polysulfide reductase [Spongiactinospora rosea]|uniref:Polysulfide reductase n=2 Tax=Spongiactinospora rosea TaxID=2248750 RepID=A0A366LNA0_9ACTN|nr:polysulfide reductase [Spongiactinospora rosea]
MVPEPEFRSYYGQPIIKGPLWHEPHMPAYLYLGGLSGASSLLAAGCELTGRDRLAAPAKIAAAAAGTAGAAFLVAELGRPERFLNMLRVFKTTSPMSVGSWILAAQSGLAAVAAGSALTGLLPSIGKAAGLATGITGPMMATYTAVLVADTAVPSWHTGHRELPFLFAGSALASAGAVAMVAAPHREAGPARRMAMVGAAMETVAGEVLERRLGLLAEPYREGSAGRLMRAARVLTVTGGALAAVSGLTRWRTPSVLSAAALTAGSLCVRFGVLRAGRASAADPKYTVVPQRERIDARERNRAHGR